jgi:hypothetical protein
MGVYVQSRIIAERIEPEAWQALYAQTLDFLNRCSLDLMGLGPGQGPHRRPTGLYPRNRAARR